MSIASFACAMRVPRESMANSLLSRIPRAYSLPVKKVPRRIELRTTHRMTLGSWVRPVTYPPRFVGDRYARSKMNTVGVTTAVISGEAI